MKQTADLGSAALTVVLARSSRRASTRETWANDGRYNKCMNVAAIRNSF
jgi:hypothetical protein